MPGRRRQHTCRHWPGLWPRPLPPRGGPCSSCLIRPALLTQETGRRGPLSVPNRCPLSRFPRTCPALRACARRPRPDALFARTAGARLVAEALSEVLPGPLCLAVQIRHSVLYRAVPRDPGWSLRPTRDGKGEPTVKMNFSCSTARSKVNRGVKNVQNKAHQWCWVPKHDLLLRTHVKKYQLTPTMLHFL